MSAVRGRAELRGQGFQEDEGFSGQVGRAASHAEAWMRLAGRGEMRGCTKTVLESLAHTLITSFLPDRYQYRYWML